MVGEFEYLTELLQQFKDVCLQETQNPFEHEEYECGALIEMAVRNRDFEALKEKVIRKPVFMFIEIQVFKCFKDWCLNAKQNVKEIEKRGSLVKQ